MSTPLASSHPRSAMPEPQLHTLANGARLLVLGGPWRTACVSVFVQSGSAHERHDAGESGISHVVEHMAFKGTSTRDAQAINRDAERLGAEVNAHTDKDHTAYQMRGRPEHLDAMLEQLAEIVCDAQFPADELERERQVILQEVAEDADDPVSTTFKLFDRACFGLHPAAWPVIGSAARIARFTRGQLQAFVKRQYGARNLVVAVALPQAAMGTRRLGALLRLAEGAFAMLPPGAPNRVSLPGFVGGMRSRRDAASSQAHLVLGWATPALAPGRERAAAAATLAAAVLGEGMSSPLLDELRERRGLVYHASASADTLAVCGQFVVEASCDPQQLLPVLGIVRELLQRHAERVPDEELERARNLLAVRRLRDEERPLLMLERAALDLFTHGRVRSPAELEAAEAALDARAVREVFAKAAGAGLALALGGGLPRAVTQRVGEAMGDWLRH